MAKNIINVSEATVCLRMAMGINLVFSILGKSTQDFQIEALPLCESHCNLTAHSVEVLSALQAGQKLRSRHDLDSTNSCKQLSSN